MFLYCRFPLIQKRPFSVSMASLDMTLEDRIKNRRNTSDKGGRGQGRARRGRGGPGGPARGGRPFGAPRRNPLGVNARPSSFSIAKASSMSYAFHRQICYAVVTQ